MSLKQHNTLLLQVCPTCAQERRFSILRQYGSIVSLACPACQTVIELDTDTRAAHAPILAVKRSEP